MCLELPPSLQLLCLFQFHLSWQLFEGSFQLCLIFPVTTTTLLILASTYIWICNVQNIIIVHVFKYAGIKYQLNITCTRDVLNNKFNALKHIFSYQQKLKQRTGTTLIAISIYFQSFIPYAIPVRIIWPKAQANLLEKTTTFLYEGPTNSAPVNKISFNLCQLFTKVDSNGGKYDQK